MVGCARRRLWADNDNRCDSLAPRAIRDEVCLRGHDGQRVMEKRLDAAICQ